MSNVSIFPSSGVTLPIAQSDVSNLTTDLANLTTALNLKLAIADIRDDLTSIDTDKPLSANQGRVLKGLIDAINTLLSSDDTTLDELQEIVDYIKLNRSDLDSLGIPSIAGLQTALNNKSDNSHNHTLAGLSEKSYNSLTDKPTIPSLPPTVSQAEAEEGLGTDTRLWTPERVKQAIESLGGESVNFLGFINSSNLNSTTAYVDLVQYTYETSPILKANQKYLLRYVLKFDLSTCDGVAVTLNIGSPTRVYSNIIIDANGNYNHNHSKVNDIVNFTTAYDTLAIEGCTAIQMSATQETLNIGYKMTSGIQIVCASGGFIYLQEVV